MSEEFIVPQPSRFSRKEINYLAEKLGEKLEFTVGDPLEPIVEKIGGTIHFQEMNDWYSSESGSILVHGPKNFEIFISNFTGPLRNRFTIAHELGHYILHSLVGDIAPMRVARYGSGTVEWEANTFAAGFLMPETQFAEALDQFENDYHLSAHFLVSLSATKIRKKYFEKKS